LLTEEQISEHNYLIWNEDNQSWDIVEWLHLY
jgi:hypothetical protein